MCLQHLYSNLFTMACSLETLIKNIQTLSFIYRNHFRSEAPELLPRLLSCVEWGDRAEAASVSRMLMDWPTLPLASALELLDYAYADAAVRSFAVKCLEKIR